MSTPQGWQTPKTDWDSKDPVGVSDLNRMEGNPLAIETGDRTLDPAQAPTGNVGSLGQILSWFANRIKAIMGTTNWWDAPPVTLSGATPNTRKITAGHGLTGGGDLSADRAIAMGTPSTITATTSNSVTSTSHTHALSGATPNTRKITAGSGLAGGGDLSADRTIALSDALQSTTRVLAVSDTVRYSALTERSHDGQDEKIVKKFMVNGLGTIRLTFELRLSAGGGPTAGAYARAYGNAVELALAKSSSTSYESFSLDVDVFGTTLIEVAIYRGSISTTAYIRNVRVRYDVAEVGDEGVLLD